MSNDYWKEFKRLVKRAEKASGGNSATEHKIAYMHMLNYAERHAPIKSEIATRADAQITELNQSITVRDTEIAMLETDLELARMDAGLLKQIERAAELLPDGYQIQLTVENGAATVEMCDGQEWTHIERDDATLADEISNAIDAARAGNGGGV